jgi:FkbM family methyltransferase
MKAKVLITAVCILLAAAAFFNRQIKDLILATSLPEIYCQYFRDLREHDADHVVSKLENGMQIIINKHDRCVCRFIRVTGHWDANELKVLNKIVRPGFKVIEVGGNFGCYTLTMAGLVGTTGKVHSFEANPRVSKYLEESVKLNNLQNIITIHHKAASNKHYNGMMVYGLANIGGGYILDNTEAAKKVCENNDCVPIEAVTLDSMFENEKIDLLKIDAEGAEPWIIEGAEKMLKNNPNIILMMEWIASHMQRNGVDVKKFAAKLMEHNFKFWAVKPGGSLQKITEEDLFSGQALDIIACAHDIEA